MKRLLDRFFFYLLGLMWGAILMTLLLEHQQFGFRSPGAGHVFAETTFQAPAPILYTKTFRVSAYCSCPKCCGKFSDGITASGHKIQPGDKFVAAPKEFPFGTAMLIPGYDDNLVLVRDRGGAIKDNRLDVFFPTHQEALNWGVKYVNVTIYDYSPSNSKLPQ